MKLRTLLAKIYKIPGYLRKRRKAKLYRQWLESGDLTPGAIPQEEVAEVIIPKIDKHNWRLPILYILLGILIGALGMGLILFLLQSC
ncbi:hypothetical protein ACFLXX_04515 [Chloroflexota bacterium]